MNILLVNDDGFGAKGQLALVKALEKDHTLTVVSPDSERSGFSHALTLHRKVYVAERALPGFSQIPAYSISGTPADCTKMGILLLCEKRPDMVISGINLGENIGTNVCYSGTFSAAAEGAMAGIRSVAVSQAVTSAEDDVDFAFAAQFTAGLVESVLDLDIPASIVLNINIPHQNMRPYQGIRVTAQSNMLYDEHYELIDDKGGGVKTYLLKGKLLPDETPMGDATAMEQGYISISPMKYNKTDEPSIAFLKRMES